MPSVYLQSADYATYGVPTATANQVISASTLIDSFLKRDEGLIYTNGGNNSPCYMSKLTPTNTLTTSQSITPGTNVSVNFTGGFLPANMIGYVAILDRLNPAVTEYVVIYAVTGNTVTLANTLYSHSSGALIEFGLVIAEQRQMPQGRPITSLFKCPVMNILGGQGRYGYGRRNASDNMVVNEYNLLAAVSAFGGPPVWETFNPSISDVDQATGELWAPAGIMLAYYTEIRVFYIAGFTYATLPSSIKQACANIINASTQLNVNAGIKSMQAGDTKFERFSNTLLDKDTQEMLNPYKARAFV